jgi:Protein of unknown function (DUF3999)
MTQVSSKLPGLTAPDGRGSTIRRLWSRDLRERSASTLFKSPGQSIGTVALLLLFAMLATAAPLDLSAWKYRKRIPLTPGDELAVVKLDREVYAAIGSRYYKMRVFREREEVPFICCIAVRPFNDSTVTTEQILDQSIVPDIGLQFIVHRLHAGTHNKIDIFTDLKNFRNRVRIETSQDGSHWAIARDDGAIFNFSQDGREFSSTSVEYPVSKRPFLRVTIFGWTKNGLVTGAVVDHNVEKAVPFETYAKVTPQVTDDPKARSTIVQIDLGMTGLPVRRLRLETTSPQFQRAVGVETSDDARSWSYDGGGTIARLPGAEFSEEWLTVLVGSEHRYYRLRIYNLDDKPIHVGHVQAEGDSYLLKFLAATPGSYWLYYGGPGPELTAMPEYDLAKVLYRQSLPEHTWTLDRQEPSPFYRPPPPPKKPWSEQHPAILYTVLGGAVLALGIATFRFASRLRRPS